MHNRLVKTIVVFLWAITAPNVLYAHSVSRRFGDFYGGMLHPMTALEHLIPIIALSLLAGQHGRRPARCVLLAFPLALLVGTTAGIYGPSSAFISTFNQTSLVVLGVLVAAAIRQPIGGLFALAILFGITHGYENGMSTDPSTVNSLFVSGVSFTGIFMVAVVSAAAVSLSQPWQHMAVRIVGSWIAAIGMMMIALP